MPVHDWTRVSAGPFHDFHYSWVLEIKRALKRGVLPPGYYVMAEQLGGDLGAPDVLTLQAAGTKPESADPLSGTATLTETPPVVQVRTRIARDPYARLQRTLVIRHTSKHQVIAMVVIVSPGNKSNRHGIHSFLQKARESGVDGIVVPDLPVEESEEFRNISLKHNVDNIYLAAPNTSRTRLRTVLDKSKGFLYLVSIYGVTGPRDSLSPQALEAVRAVKFLARGKIPVSAGFGISQPEHVSAVIQSGADGAIVGSALVRIVGNHLDDPGEAETQLKKTVQSLKEATRLRSD